MNSWQNDIRNCSGFTHQLNLKIRDCSILNFEIDLSAERKANRLPVDMQMMYFRRSFCLLVGSLGWRKTINSGYSLLLSGWFGLCH